MKHLWKLHLKCESKTKYKRLCAACHGFTGDLNVNGAKDLTASKIPLEESVAQIYHGKGLMTPFKGLLKDHEIVAVAKYIEQNLLFWDGDILLATKKGKFLVDGIASDLFMVNLS